MTGFGVGEHNLTLIVILIVYNSKIKLINNIVQQITL